MKKVIIVIFTLHCSLLTVHLYSQSCLEEGILFRQQWDIDNFQSNNPNCTEIEGNVTIWGNDNISNLDSLNVLTSIGGDLDIIYSDSLPNLSGLHNITYIGGNLRISWNAVLTELTGLENLRSIDGNCIIGEACGRKKCGNQNLLSLSGLERLTHIGGNLSFEYNDSLKNFSGLDSLTFIGGHFQILNNPSLNSFNGLESLTSIIGNLMLCGIRGSRVPICVGNQALISLVGLNNLVSIGGNFDLGSCDSLTNLAGLENLTFIGGDLNIGIRLEYSSSWLEFPGSESLSDLKALASLTSIGGQICIVENPKLTSLIGLDNIIAGSITDIYIYNNDSLSNCSVLSICEYLKSPFGNSIIHDNETGCNNLEEVEELCLGVGIEEEKLNQDMTVLISPNPCSDAARLRYLIHDTRSLGSARDKHLISDLFDISGRKIQGIIDEKVMPGEYEKDIDVSALPAGVYFVRVQAGTEVAVRKLIIR